MFRINHGLPPDLFINQERLYEQSKEVYLWLLLCSTRITFFLHHMLIPCRVANTFEPFHNFPLLRGLTKAWVPLFHAKFAKGVWWSRDTTDRYTSLSVVSDSFISFTPKGAVKINMFFCNRHVSMLLSSFFGVKSCLEGL